jgi:hypothetical protein
MMTDQELAALAEGTPMPMSISLDEVLKNVTIDPEYAFLVTQDNALLMGCLASVAKYQKNIACSPDQTVWDIVGAVLKRQVQMVSTAEEKD